jgi:predicted nucleic acid-binding protein
MFLLDTNVISELRRAGRCDPNVAAWVARQPNATLFISTITLMDSRSACCASSAVMPP